MTTADEGVIAYVSIGANIDAESSLRKAVAMLREKCEVLALSSVYQSPAYGWEDQPDFLDITAKVSTALTPLDFKTQVIDGIERACGRDRASQLDKYGPLPMDIDILLWGESAFEFGEKPWKVPNKGIVKFAAVAIPLAEIAPEVRHPVEGVTITEIAERFDEAEIRAVRKVPLDLGSG
jgi:2-amino-4-hydroxy-6-hydroxymethyldihydropteridine diphosphokinase